MLSIFCLRLAAGLIGSLLLLFGCTVNPRFYRVHFLTALGLAAVALCLSWSSGGPGLTAALVCSMLLAFAGSFVWSLDKTPGGQALIVATLPFLVASLGLLEWSGEPEGNPVLLAANSLTSAALLGSATTAMLLGHSYLIAPTMSITPLLRLVTVVLATTVARMAIASLGLWFWTARHSLFNLEDETVLWLPLRWGLGFVGPLVLGWMAWQTARIRSTQSATGILYVVVIFCFLGELTSQLLLGDTHVTL
jgi:hypothetical protein